MAGDYLASLADNPYFGAGAGLFGIGTALAVGRKGLVYATMIFRRQCMMSMEVPSRDRSYQWLLQWITSASSLSSSAASRHLSVETTHHEGESGKMTTRFDFVPSPGEHYFRYASRWIKVDRQRATQSTITANPFESVTLTTLGRDRRFFERILEEAHQLAQEQAEGRTRVYIPVGPEWRQFGFPRRKRPLASVVLDRGVGETIYGDVREFIASSQWYADRGVPWRRGYLLYGPPGCGKSSFILALAGALDYSICILSLSERTLTDDRLAHLLNIAPLESVLVLEDVDAAFVSRVDHPQLKAAYEGLSRVTFSGLLNALDGVGSSDARILFMTTNYVERLDPALIRPGRVDRKELIDHCTDYQLEQMFLRFYPSAPPAMAGEFVKHARSVGRERVVSAAQVQGYFLTTKERPDLAVASVEQLFTPSVSAAH